jgi:hypothetical protein
MVVVGKCRFDQARRRVSESAQVLTTQAFKRGDVILELTSTAEAVSSRSSKRRNRLTMDATTLAFDMDA